MKYNKGHFYLTWIIFGMICIFSFDQFIRLLSESFIVLGIIINIEPIFLKYLNFIVYGIVALTLIFISIKVFIKETIVNYSPDFKKLRKYLVLILGTGILSKVLEHFLMQYRIEIFNEYIESHNVEFIDIYQTLFIYPTTFWIFMFLYFIVLFFILTKNIEKTRME